FPFFFTAIGLANEAPKGVVPDSVIWSFYIGAAILILCVIYTTVKVKEWPPKEYAQYNPVEEVKDEGKADWFTLLKNAPRVFWQVGLVQFFCWAAFMYMWTYTNGSIASVCFGVDMTAADATSTAQYQTAGNWVGILFAVQAIGSVIWAAVLPQFKNRKVAYAVSLVLGGIGFATIPLFSNQYVQFIPFLLIGCAWAAMLAMPFTFVTNALQGYGHMGAYLGLFNGTICVPQIVAALVGGIILSLVGSVQSNMMIVAGVFLILGAVCVFNIKERAHA
ncbi:MAG: MFS transporter, partial [Prevotella sp.]|nr:MFS transporter [Prevotella sp.]